MSPGSAALATKLTPKMKYLQEAFVEFESQNIWKNKPFNRLDATCSSIFVASMIKWLGAHGVSRRDMLEGTNISDAMLTDPDAAILYSDYSKLISNAYKNWGKPDLGVTIGSEFNTASLGVLAQAGVTADSIKDSIQVFSKYFSIKAEYVWFKVQHFDEKLKFTFFSAPQDELVKRFHLDIACCANKKLFSALYSDDMKIVLSVEHNDMRYIDSYRKIFPDGVIFGQKSTSVIFDPVKLSKLLPHRNKIAAKLAERHCQSELDLAKTRNLIANSRRRDIIKKVRNILIEDLGAAPSVKELSKRLNLSERTFRRYIASHNTSYRQILIDVRTDRASTLLKDPLLPLSKISEELGFSSTGSFAREFKKWSGQTPNEFRRANHL